VAGPELEPGKIFAGDFQVEGPLAAGGMGAVYRVRQLSTGRLRALKVMHPDLLLDDEARARFAQEARVGGHIASAHVVEVHGAGVDESTGAPYLVMELLRGEDLESRIARAGPLGPGAARELFRQVCHAMAAAHDARIVHRDLKPSNVFLAESLRAGATDVEVKVLDFGIAKLALGGPLTAHVATAAGTLLGTPLWMAPEQSDAGAVGPAADVWALGLMLYYVLTGRSFWRSGNSEHASLQEFFRELLVDPIPSPVARAGQQGGSYPANLEIVFRRSVARAPLTRFPDASAFWSALDAALVSTPRVALAPAPRSPAVSKSAPTLAAMSPDEVSGLELADTGYVSGGSPSRFASAEAVAGFVPPVRAAPPEPRRGVVPLFVIGVAVVGAVFFGLRLREHGTYVGTCRLCTLEGDKTFANGPIPLREVRHDVEALLPEYDKRCLGSAKRGGHLLVRFSVVAIKQTEHYTLQNLRADGDDDTARCLTGLFKEIDFGSQPIGTHGQTDVSYSLDFDPNHQ
jgi:serine/threonine protein kinase